MAFLTPSQLASFGFAHVGSDVLVSNKASIHGAARISLGDHCRVDDFAILSAGEGGISIGRHVHVSCQCSILGQGRIELHDYSGISSRVAIYSSNDDYSGEWMTNPTVPAKYTHVTHGPVTLCQHVIVGSGSIILPNVTLAEGVVIGALSLVRSDCETFTVYAGYPARRIGPRQRKLLELAQQLVESQRHQS